MKRNKNKNNTNGINNEIKGTKLAEHGPVKTITKFSLILILITISIIDFLVYLFIEINFQTFPL